MRTIHDFAYRHFGTSHGLPAFALRHRAFAERLRVGREGGRHVSPVSYVLLRQQTRVLRQLFSPLHFSLQLVHRASGLGSLPQQEKQMQSPKPAASHRYERMHVLMRLLERASQVSHFRHSRMFVGVALPQATTAMMPGTADSNRVQMIQRVEREILFPRVAQIVRVSTPLAASPASAAELLTQAAHARPAPLRTTPMFTVPLATAVLPPAELSRVTDHVIQQLDRRVLSYKERMGRV
jgi:hypothetical protein